jgi:hypothetical protein
MSKNIDLVVSSVNTRVRFEQWAKNPTCEANTVSAVLNVPLGKVAEKLGFENKKDLPPFAIARGLSFEKYLFDDGASRLVTAMTSQKMLTQEEDVEFIDFRHQGNLQGRSRSAERSLELSTEFFETLSKGTASKVTKIVSGLVIKLAKGVMLPEATLILDCLVVKWIDGPAAHWGLEVGEIKIFPDRGGYTDPDQISSARAQAGVYKHALDQWLLENATQVPFEISTTGFLVFTWPGSTFPVVRANEDLGSQAQRAKEGFNRMDEIGRRVVLPNLEGFSAGKHIDWVAHSKTNFREACWQFCDLAERCQDQALANSRAIFLGSETSRVLGTSQIDRTLELMNGAAPDSEFEVSLVGQLLEAESGLF